MKKSLFCVKYLSLLNYSSSSYLHCF